MTVRGSLDDLAVFAVVARTRSFTRAAAELGMSTSMLSYTIKRLEGRLELALLQRNSRSVAPTAAGERLLEALDPALETIVEAVGDLRRERDSVSGTVRLTVTRQAFDAVIRPALPIFHERHPRASIEVVIDYGFRDIVADRFDAGIRLGEKLEQDMIALKVSPDFRMAVVAAPSYLAAHGAPATPQDLSNHRCINYRMVGAGSLYAWEFEGGGRELEVKVPGLLVTNEPGVMLDVALDGLGIAYVLEHEVASHLADGRLTRLLEDWTPPFPGFFLYYPSRRRTSPVLRALIAALRCSS